MIINALRFPIHSGDWHDKPMRYEVVGPENEVQYFSTKKAAEKYRSIRRRAASFSEAVRLYCSAK